MNRQFADVSSNNSGFSAAPYASSGHGVIGIKATEGTGFVNPDYSKWVTDAHNHRLAVLHYHFARPESGNPVTQAQHFMNTVEPHFHRPGDFVVVDLETANPATVRPFYETLRNTLRHAGHSPWLYTYVSYLASSNLAADGEPLWIAAYGSRNPAGLLWRFHGYDVAAWQQTDGQNGPQPHSYAGIPGTCDGSLLSPNFARKFAKATGR